MNNENVCITQSIILKMGKGRDSFIKAKNIKIKYSF